MKKIIPLLALTTTWNSGFAFLTTPPKCITTTTVSATGISPKDEGEASDADAIINGQKGPFQSLVRPKGSSDGRVSVTETTTTPVLADCPFAGNVGFDPLHLAKSREQLWRYREAEIKHARLAMLAVVGWPISQVWNRVVDAVSGSELEIDPFLLDTAERGLWTGGLDRLSPVWWGFCVGLIAVIDLYGMAKKKNTGYQPGLLGFDPFALYPSDAKGQKVVQEAEIELGRLAMFAVPFYSVEELVANEAIESELPLLLSAFQ